MEKSIHPAEYYTDAIIPAFSDAHPMAMGMPSPMLYCGRTQILVDAMWF